MKYTLILTCLFISLSLWGQKLHKDYAFYPQEEGNLYFIFPQKGFRCSDPDITKGLEYDLTYFTANDSVVLAYTCVSPFVCKSDTVSLLDQAGNSLYVAPAEMLFVQPKGKNWEQRATVKIPYSRVVSLYHTPSPFTLRIHTPGRTVDYHLSSKDWKKQTFLVSRIFEMITYNESTK